MIPVPPKVIWIDIDNSPHVPFFIPILEELEKIGYQVVLTARNTYQVSDLLRYHGLSSKVHIGGRHWGKYHTLKLLGTGFRAVQLLPVILKYKPSLAISHGSRAQMLSSYMTHVPCIVMFDYEFVDSKAMLFADWAFMPNLISEASIPGRKIRIMKYPGLKEDVYVNRLIPDPSVKDQLGVGGGDVVVTVRPPATEAHYHNPEAEILLDAVLELLIRRSNVRIILLPRNGKQAKLLREQWRQSIEDRKIVIPSHVVDGINLIWFSDLVVSGGGTMNREAAALGVPVYSIFRGYIGAVDRYLAEHGRLTMLTSVEDVHTKLDIRKRVKKQANTMGDNTTLNCIVNAIRSIVEHGSVSQAS